MTIEIFNCPQNSPEWLMCRLGLPTASKFATVLAKGEGKTRSKYLRELAGEIITGEPTESYFNAHMERGRLQEDEARQHYAFIHDVEPQQVGFVRNGLKGCSPDGLIGENGGLEIKSALPHIQIERLKKDELPPEHKAQVQGGMWVAEREWWDFVSYWPRLPIFVKRVYRDEEYIKQLATATITFNEELAELVEWLRSYDRPRDETRGILKNKFVQSMMAG